MQFSGQSVGGISLNGYKTDVLKSSVQKYIRRCVLDKALYSCWELELFHNMLQEQLDDTKRKGLKGFLTNVINRLLIISIEDIGIGCIGMPAIVKHAYREYKHGDSSARRRALYVLVSSLCESKKSRELSHINCVFYQILHSDKKEEYTSGYPDVYNFDRSYEDFLVGFIKLYNQGSDGCFYYFLVQLHKNGNKSVLSMLMHVIDSEQNYRRKDIMKILFEWYKEFSFKEYFIFGLQIILIGLRKELQVDIEYINSKIKQMDDITNKEWEQSYALNIGGYKIEMDEYVIDKHTREGRKKGKDLKVFANEGCHVENEHPLVNQQYKEIYISFRQSVAIIEHEEKQEHSCMGITKTGNPCKNKGKYQNDDQWYCSIHNSSSTIKEPEQLLIGIKHNITQQTLDMIYLSPRGQLMTGKHKKQLFIPVEGKLLGKVVKGPWTTNDIPKLNRLIIRLHEAQQHNVACLPFIIATAVDGNMYTIYRNLSTIESSKWLFDEKQDPYVSYPDTVKIVQRESMGIRQLHKCDKQTQYNILFGDQFLIKGIVLMNIFKMGDLGPYNILVTSDNVGWIVDYEENTTRDIFSEIGHLYAKPAKCYTEQFIQGIKSNREKIQKLIEEFDKDYDNEERWHQIRDVIKMLL